MKNFTVITLMFLTLSMASIANAAPKTAIIFVSGDSGVETNAEVFTAQKEQFFRQVMELRKSRQFTRSHFQMISSSLARPVFYGSVSDLSSGRAQDILDKSAIHTDRCNQLAASFEALRSSVMQLTQQGFEEIHIYIFSSLISTPTPCADVKIVLPQLPVPVNFMDALASSPSVKTIVFYAVNPHQMRPYQEALQPLAAWATANGKTFAMFDLEATINELRFGLTGVEK